MNALVGFGRLAPDDAEALACFYNGLSEAAIRTFRPLGLTTTLAACAAVCAANVADAKYDLVARDPATRAAIGWSFLWDLQAEGGPTFGLAVAAGHRGIGLGSALIDRVLAEARRRELPGVELTVVKDNAVALGLYLSRGFVIYGERYDEADGLDYHRMRLTLSEPGAGAPRGC